MDLIVAINMLCSAALCLGAGWLIMTRKVHEGPLIKLGLGLLALAMFGVATLMPELAELPRGRPLLHAMLLGNAGLAVIAAGLAWRVRHSPEALSGVKTISGWTPLDGQPAADQ